MICIVTFAYSLFSQFPSNSCIRNGTFCLNSHLFRGGHGDVFKAYRLLADDSIDFNTSLILKRMSFHNRPFIELCAKREIYFGEILRQESFVARYITHFKTPSEYWLVFKDEGISLQQVFFTLLPPFFAFFSSSHFSCPRSYSM